MRIPPIPGVNFLASAVIYPCCNRLSTLFRAYPGRVLGTAAAFVVTCGYAAYQAGLITKIYQRFFNNPPVTTTSEQQKFINQVLGVTDGQLPEGTFLECNRTGFTLCYDSDADEFDDVKKLLAEKNINGLIDWLNAKISFAAHRRLSAADATLGESTLTLADNRTASFWLEEDEDLLSVPGL